MPVTQRLPRGCGLRSQLLGRVWRPVRSGQLAAFVKEGSHDPRSISSRSPILERQRQLAAVDIGSGELEFFESTHLIWE